MTLSDDIKDLIEHETTQAQLMLRRLAEEMPTSADAHYLLGVSHLRRLEFGLVHDLDPRPRGRARIGALADSREPVPTERSTRPEIR